MRPRRFVLVLASVAALGGPVCAQVDPDPLIAPVVFHWGQVRTPWPTLEGGATHDGSQSFWARQIELLESAGFNGQLFQVASGWEASQRNHLAAQRFRHASQPLSLPPRVVPFFAAETFPDYLEPKDVVTPAGLERFYQAIRAFFSMYAEYFPATGGQRVLDPELLAKVDRRVLVVLWWVPLTSYELPPTFFSGLSDRLERDFGFRAYWSVHEWFASGGPDDVNSLFNGAKEVQWGRNTKYPAADLLVGFWPPNLEGYSAELFAPRDGGATYTAAWDAVIAARPRPSIVFVESYNEVTEGSQLMPSWPVAHTPGDGHWRGAEDAPCAAQPCHQVEFADAWGSANPWHYLDLTRRKVREWLEGPPPGDADRIPPHALIVAPRDGQVVSGVTALRVAAADDRALREVRVYLDGDLLIRTSGPIDLRLKTAFLANGTHVLAVEVTDQTGNVDQDLSEFVVRN